MSGMLKSIAALTIMVLATLAVLVVFGIVPRELLGDYSARIVLTACILAITGAALTLLLRSGKS